MRETNVVATIATQALTAGRVVLATMTVCCLLYGLFILSVGQLFVPDRAEGSLLRNVRGEVVGSVLIAQEFSKPEFFWPRPSAAGEGYTAASSGGSNLSPANPELRARAAAIASKMGATAASPIPADLVTASGSGLDPHITFASATCQAARVASARGLPVTTVTGLLDLFAKRSGGVLAPEPLVNVLLVNMALERLDRKNGQ